MIKYGSKKDVEEYFSSSALSQSILKLLMKGVKYYNSQNESDLYYEEKKHFVIGSAVDCILTMGQEAYEKEYFISTLEKPSDTIMSMVHHVMDNFNWEDVEEAVYLKDLSDFVLEACNEHEYQRNWKDETRINKVIELGTDYFNELLFADGRQMLSKEQGELIEEIVTSIKTNQTIKDYFQDGENMEILFQVPIYFEINDIPCQALLDALIINHETKEIIIVDFKTIGDETLAFPKAVKQRRYDIQAAWYTEAVTLSGKYDGYTTSFKFIVESTISQGTPLVFNCDNDLIYTGKFGKPGEYNAGRHIPPIRGFMYGLELYMWHLANGFEVDRIVEENNSELQLDWSGIINERERVI